MIYELITERLRNAYEITQATWGNDCRHPGAFLTLSEVMIGHADLLVNEGRVREVNDGNVISYEAVE